MGCMMRQIRLAKPWITDAEKQAVLDVMDSGWLTEGEKVAEFEEDLAKYVGVKHAILVPNATIGLELLMGSFPPRAEICVPAFSHPATALAARNKKCRIVFCDVNLTTGNVDQFEFDSVAHCNNIDGVVPVSWGGNPLPVEFYDEARDYGVRVIEDAACSLGACDTSGHNVGTRAFATVFSFHPRKIVTIGEGGAVVTNNDSLARSIRRFKNFGGPGFLGGTNLKVSDINAALGIAQLERIDDIIERRRHLARLYDKLCDGCGIKWGRTDIGYRTAQSYCAYVPHRDRLIHDLAELGIETQVGTYYLPDLFASCDEFSHARALADHLLTLPLHHEITEEDQEFVVESIATLLKSYEV